MSSLEGALTSSVWLSRNHFPNSCEGRQQRGGLHRPGLQTQHRTATTELLHPQVLEPPQGPELAICRRCQRVLCQVFLETQRSVPAFLSFSFSFLLSFFLSSSLSFFFKADRFCHPAISESEGKHTQAVQEHQ